MAPPKVDRIWLWAYYNKIPIYSICYLLKGDTRAGTLNPKSMWKNSLLGPFFELSGSILPTLRGPRNSFTKIIPSHSIQIPRHLARTLDPEPFGVAPYS